jgi:hypothetical protein
MANAVADALPHSERCRTSSLARPRLAHEFGQTSHQEFGLTIDAIQTAVRFARNNGAPVYVGDDAFCANSVTRRCLAEDLRRVVCGPSPFTRPWMRALSKRSLTV